MYFDCEILHHTVESLCVLALAHVGTFLDILSSFTLVHTVCIYTGSCTALCTTAGMFALGCFCSPTLHCIHLCTYVLVSIAIQVCSYSNPLHSTGSVAKEKCTQTATEMQYKLIKHLITPAILDGIQTSSNVLKINVCKHAHSRITWQPAACPCTAHCGMQIG